MRVALFHILLTAGLLTSCSGMDNQNRSGMALEPAFPSLNFTRPVDLQHPGDGSNRLFVVEQAGIIYVFENRRDATEKKVFLDIREKVNDQGNEEGLLGLAFHPAYADNGTFYIDYTAANPRRTVIARYRVKPDDPLQADPGSEAVILEVPQPYSNHNGGQTVFGPDGYLYISFGDGGAGGDPQGNGQNRKTLLGSIVRIDPDNPQNGSAYGIPADNPFAGNQQGFREEIYAYGLRNVWRFSFDPENGWLWAADVGQNKYEEVDIIRKGKNYGWNIMEGFHSYEPRPGQDTLSLVEPVWEYSHQVGQSITGGFVYRGTAVPDLKGAYICADYVSGPIWALRYDGSGKAQSRKLLDSGLNIASFGTDARNELYMCAFDGKIYRFKPAESK